jgi:hypothetical protein
MFQRNDEKTFRQGTYAGRAWTIPAIRCVLLSPKDPDPQGVRRRQLIARPLLVERRIGTGPAAGASCGPLRLAAGDDRRPIRDGKLLEVRCDNCRPERHLYLNPEILRLPMHMPVPVGSGLLVCSKCGARNRETYHPIWARPDARVGDVGHYPDFSRR